MLLEPAEERLVQHKHGARLYARPDGARADTPEPARNAFRLVDELKAFNHRRRIKSGS